MPGGSAARLLAILALALLLAACGTRKTRPKRPAAGSPAAVTQARPDQPGDYVAGGLYKPGVRDSGPASAPDLSHLTEPTPRDEPRARYGNRSPYTVLGKSYHVMDSSSGYVARGIASWYGEKFHGRATSSLEPYDMYQFTAAHKSLPLPTYVRVTHLANGRSVVVRVNDRGPFHEDRLIDLSYAAAIRIGMHVEGTAPVEIRVLEPGQEPPPPPAPLPVEQAWQAARAGTVPASRATAAVVASGSSAAAARTWLQAGSFGRRANARDLAKRLDAAGLAQVSVKKAKIGGRTMYRVRLGPYRTPQQADADAQRLVQMGLGPPARISD